MAANPHHQWTLEQYIEHEKHTDTRYEYIDQQIYAMIGGTLRHAHISGNIFFALSLSLRGGPCRAYNPDVGIAAQTQRKYFYPDVSVACGEIEIDPALPLAQKTTIKQQNSTTTNSFPVCGITLLLSRIACMSPITHVVETCGRQLSTKIWKRKLLYPLSIAHS
jgi:hypothetical protein